MNDFFKYFIFMAKANSIFCCLCLRPEGRSYVYVWNTTLFS